MSANNWTATIEQKKRQRLPTQAEMGHGEWDRRAGTLELPLSHADKWEKPLPLGGDVTVPALPLHLFPAGLAEWIDAESEAKQTPSDLAAMLALAIGGAAIAKKVRVEIRQGWTEPTNLFTVTALPPGERKSIVFSDAMVPVQEHERQEKERMAPIIAEAKSRQRMLERKLKVTEEAAAKAKDPGEIERLTQEAMELAKQLASHVVLNEVQLSSDDITPQSLVQELERQGGKILQAAPEGTAFEIAKGRYSESPDFDVYLKGHAGDALRTNRISREKEYIEEPALSCAFAVQPDVIAGLADTPSMKARGFLARWLYAIPKSMAGSRKVAPKPVHEIIKNGYRDIMLALWRIETPVNEHGEPTPFVLPFSPEADAVLQDFERWLEPRLAEGEDLSHLAGWANKLAGAVARISGIFHVLEAVDRQSRWQTEISAATVSKVIAFAREYLIGHARTAFGLMTDDKRLPDARRVVAYLAKQFSEFSEKLNGPFLFRASQIHSGVFGGGKYSPEDVKEVLNLVEEHGYIRLFQGQTEKKAGPGRHPGATYEVHPEIAQAVQRIQSIQKKARS